MKKIIFMLSMFVTISLFAQEVDNNWRTFKAGIDILGSSDVKDVFNNDSLSGNQNTEIGYSITIEGFKKITSFISIGVGFNFQFNRAGRLGFPVEDSTLTLQQNNNYKTKRGKFGYIPVYALIKLNLYESEIITPRIVGQFGYNLFYGDDNYKKDLLLVGGMYYAFGFELNIYKDFLIEAVYKVDNGSASHAEEKIFDTKYSYLSLAIGINF